MLFFFLIRHLLNFSLGLPHLSLLLRKEHRGELNNEQRLRLLEMFVSLFLLINFVCLLVCLCHFFVYCLSVLFVRSDSLPSFLLVI